MTRISIKVVLAAALLSSHAIADQGPQGTEPPRFRVSVDAVRIDAVVTDRDGRIVTDLTADDFEVRQNGRPQQVTFAQFVPVLSAPESASNRTLAPVNPRLPASSPSHAPSLLAPAPALPRANVQRTLAVVVDDLGLSVESLFSVKRALHTFIDNDLQPADLAGILRTGGSTGALQPFTMDRRVLHGAVDALRWNGHSRSGVEAFEAINQWTTFDSRSGLGDLDDFTAVNRLRHSMAAAGTLGALNLAIRAARDLPGRKALLFVSEGFQMLDGGEPDTRVRAALDRVIEQATRAGVVIYSLDARGLQTGGLQASDNLKRPKPGLTMEQSVREAAAERSTFNRDTQEALAYVAEQTGGFAVLNTNDLGRGLSRISADVRDYYVIGYLPAPGTFAGPGKKPSRHKIAISVRRPGLRVKTRKEFLGVSDPEESFAPPTPAQTLVETAISPFGTTDIALTATPLPGYSPDQGLFVRTLLHIDARALTFAPGIDEKPTASADVLGMVFDRDGTEVAHLSTGFTVALNDQATDDALRAGVVYTLTVPIPKAGAYQLRFAVRDQRSGRLGNAGEFVELPDVRKGAFALSGIVLRNDEATAAADPTGAAVVRLTPAQGLRVYKPGTELSYAYEVYNAATGVQATTTIWRGTQKVATLPTDTLTSPSGGGLRFAATGRLKLGEMLPAGSYLLQVSAATADAGQRPRVRTAVQQIRFDLR